MDCLRQPSEPGGERPCRGSSCAGRRELWEVALEAAGEGRRGRRTVDGVQEAGRPFYYRAFFFYLVRICGRGMAEFRPPLKIAKSTLVTISWYFNG